MQQLSYSENGSFITSTDFDIIVSDSSADYNMKYMVGSNLHEIGLTLVTEQTKDMTFPTEVTIGENLPDCYIRGQLYRNHEKNGKLEINCTNRKVVMKETLSTKVGDFECYCVEFDFESTIVIIKNRNKKRFWYSPKLGIIKTDRHSSKGKFTGYSILNYIRE